MSEPAKYRDVRAQMLRVCIPLSLVVAVGWGVGTGSVTVGIVIAVTALLALWAGLGLARRLPPFKDE